MLRLYLFGAPRLERDRQVLRVRRSKALALLALLAGDGRAYGRDALLALLWPEFTAVAARNNLRRELSVLRSMLGEGVLIVDRQQVSWTGQPHGWVDLAAFRELIARVRQHRHAQTLCESCAEWLTQALSLASAELLDGYGLADSEAFDEWLFFQREELRQQLGWGLELLVEWHAGRGELQPALTLARRWQALDPLYEPPRRALMQLYARDGQHAAAVRQYQEVTRLLASELGSQPEPATTALYQAIRARAIPQAPRPNLQVASAPAAPINGTPVEAGLPLGQIAMALGRYAQAEQHFVASYACRAAFNDRAGMALALLGQADTAARRNDQRQAELRYTEALALYEQIGDRGGSTRAQLGLAGAAEASGALERAWTLLRTALVQARELNFQHVALDGLVLAAALFLHSRQSEQAVTLLTLALIHPASRAHTTERARQLLLACEETLPQAAFIAAVELGHRGSLERLLAQLLSAGAAEPAAGLIRYAA